jgi:serine O-acetyltransferase
MIKNKLELERILNLEKKFYINNIRDYIIKTITRNEKIEIWHFQKHLRKAEYYHNVKSKFLKFLYVYHIARKNSIGKKIGVFACINTIDEGLTIYHSGEIVVSGLAKCGKNLKLHGNNCIGNKGIDGVAPIIGDNCDIGFGAVVIGDITLGNDIKIGANAVVNRSYEKGVLVGVPARKKNNE